jgi:tetratricopeptide (TPR) repeat protein
LPGRPGEGDRPGRPGEGDRPTRPERPIIGGGGDRPWRPGEGDRPGRPGEGDRPGRPGDGDRPGRPGDGDRPGRPGEGDRPIIGGGGNRPNWPNRPDRPWIDNDNIHIGDNININNNWNNWGVNRPGWNNNHWQDHWHDNWINHRHNWYHGCWNNHWSNRWYSPIVWTGVGWGIGSWWNNSWGVGVPYQNPYWVAGSSGYDYSQPVVIQNIVTSTGGTADATGGTATAEATAENNQALTLFDEGLASFKQAQYEAALAKFDASLKLLPTDPVLHEVRALALFALGRFKESAATLNALLATAPGMDWTSMASLYGSVDDYTAQLRALEGHIKANPTDASAMFVLAYHYLVIGQTDAAIKALQEVVKLQPTDATAKRMLEGLVPPEAEESPAAATTADPATATAEPAADEPSTDLVGTWQAKAGDTTIVLTVTEDSQYIWKATPEGKPAIEIKGNLIASSDAIVLENEEQGSMIGRVTSGGADKFTFTLRGMPEDEPGLAFERVNS